MKFKVCLSIWFMSAIIHSDAAVAEDQFSSLACQLEEYTGEAPEILGATSYPVASVRAIADQCETLLVFENSQTALVQRRLKENGQTHTQVVVISTRNNSLRPIVGRSLQTTDRTSSRSTAEGGSRGGTKLPAVTERITLNGARSMGKNRIGVETFQIRFTVEQIFKTTFESSQTSRRERNPLVEFDLCGRRVNLEAGLYPAIAEKYSECENYLDEELEDFTKFWDF